MSYVEEPARRTPVLTKTQVLVVGGGSAGAGRQVVGGLCQEATERLIGRGAAHAPPRGTWGSAELGLVEQARRWGLVWGSPPHRVRYSVAYDPEEFRFCLASMCEERGVRLRGVVFQGKSGRFAVLADVVVDATGDGDVLASAGVPFDLEKVLPWLWFRMGGVEDVDAITGHWTKYGALYWIPYRSLLPAELTNLVVAGRCIWVDHRTHHATKEIPACMATGEAAGTAAALAALSGKALADLDIATLQARLRAEGAVLDLPDL